MKDKFCVAIITLGCRTNQYESEEIARVLLNHEITCSLDFAYADYYILNTCSITATADKKSRQLIARVLKLNQNAKILVLGCSSEKDATAFKDKENIIYIKGTKNKSEAANYIINDLKKQQEIKDMLLPSDEKFGVRKHLKIQDGCDNFCTYCIIPYLRNRSVSRNVDEIVKEAEKLSRNTKEIVLTGINMSDFKVDGKKNLTFLVSKLALVDARFRFGSLECGIITKEFIDEIKKAGNFCEHFHLSMQSGCDKTLRDMNRHYTKEQFISKVNILKENFDKPFIACDIIVGFPTETETDFLETIETIKQCQFSHMHIFPYSKREGTIAAKYKLIEKDIIKQREEELIKLNKIYEDKYKASLIGTENDVLIEAKTSIGGESYFYGYTRNYVKVYIKDKVNINDLVKIKLQTIFLDGFLSNCNK